MDIEVQTKAQILGDLQQIRHSLDEKNYFGFFEWIEIDDSAQGIIADGKIDGGEYKALQADIERMKRIQRLSNQPKSDEVK